MQILPKALPALLITLATVATTAGCNRTPPPPQAAAPDTAHATPAATDHLPPGIDWRQGDVDAAFVEARSSGKPLFLYWGAVWCPPCAQIKSTIFSRREFQERSRLFVPVYLDGDTPSAQRLGEQFGVVGYPTMILFRPDGTEITRLPGGVDVARYATILDVALAGARPVAELVRMATAGEALQPDDWRLLAYYSWATDNGRIIAAPAQRSTFGQLHAACPVSLQPECARLLFEYLRAAARDARESRTSLDAKDREAVLQAVTDALGSPTVRAANVENLLYAPKQVVELLSEPGSKERGALVAAWRAALDAISADGGPALSGPEQLNMMRARLLLERLANPDATLPPALLDDTRQLVARVDAATTDTFARQAMVNAAIGLYAEAGLADDAQQLLVTELGKARTPYYFMLDLADLAQKAGRVEEATGWLARAYAEAEGPATRFQWGYNYLLGLLEMTPDDAATIERVALEVLGELDDSPDAFYQRTRQRLDQLSKKLLEWGGNGEVRTAVIAKLRERSGEMCRQLPEGDEGRLNCERFLNPAPPATAVASAST